MIGRLQDWIRDLLLRKTVRSFIRGIVKAAAGGLTTHGIIDPDTAIQFVGANSEVLIGAVLFAVAQWDSYREKKQLEE